MKNKHDEDEFNITVADDQLEPGYDSKYRLDIDDSVAMDKLVMYLVSLVRGSFEYRYLIEIFKTKLDVDTCVYYSGYTIKNGLPIEFHHHPFKLRHYVETIVRKHIIQNNGYLFEHDVCKEVTELHYKFYVGLVPLSPTAHQLADMNKLAIHPDLIIGSWDKFYAEYYKFMSEDVKMVYDIYLESNANGDMSKYPEILKPKKVSIVSSNKTLITEKDIDKMILSNQISEINNESIHKFLTEKTESEK